VNNSSNNKTLFISILSFRKMNKIYFSTVVVGSYQNGARSTCPLSLFIVFSLLKECLIQTDESQSCLNACWEERPTVVPPGNLHLEG
jgi:hypothetical protein